MFRIGSMVTHPLFAGSGVVTDIKRDQNGIDIFEVFWQSIERKGFHSNKSLRLVTEVQNAAKGDS